jgi:hypothetical protein
MTTREALADVLLPSGLFIPKGTVCWIDIRGIQRDPDYWQQPEAFQPERFLDKVGCLGAFGRTLGFGQVDCVQTRCLNFCTLSYPNNILHHQQTGIAVSTCRKPGHLDKACPKLKEGSNSAHIQQLAHAPF